MVSFLNGLRRARTAVFLTASVLLTASGVVPLDVRAASLPASGGWERVQGPEGTTCARGTPYAFWARLGSINRLLIFLQGGGGCWDYATCGEGSTFFDDAVDDRDSPVYRLGIFDLVNRVNPFRHWSMLYVTYCTGDVHAGDHVQSYHGSGGATLTIRHKGFVNAAAALAWGHARWPSPEAVFVTGCSAGSVGSILHAAHVIRRYPRAAFAQLGDSEAFVFHRPINLQSDYRAHDRFPNWIPDVARIRPGEFTMARFYLAVARSYPDRTFAQYNTAHDSVQQRYYYAVPGATGRWEDAMEASLREIHAGAPNFRSYQAAGRQHCILPFDRTYDERSGGVPFRHWLDDLAGGRSVRNARCRVCD